MGYLKSSQGMVDQFLVFFGLLAMITCGLEWVNYFYPNCPLDLYGTPLRDRNGKKLYCPPIIETRTIIWSLIVDFLTCATLTALIVKASWSGSNDIKAFFGLFYGFAGILILSMTLFVFYSGDRVVVDYSKLLNIPGYSPTVTLPPDPTICAIGYTCITHRYIPYVRILCFCMGILFIYAAILCCGGSSTVDPQQQTTNQQMGAVNNPAFGPPPMQTPSQQWTSPVNPPGPFSYPNQQNQNFPAGSPPPGSFQYPDQQNPAGSPPGPFAYPGQQNQNFPAGNPPPGPLQYPIQQNQNVPAYNTPSPFTS